MAKSIDALLKKKRWTGKEVGKVLMASIIHDIKHQGKPGYKPLFNQAELDRLVSSLETEREGQTYNVYVTLYDSLIEHFNKGQSLYQQYYHGYYRYFMHLSICHKQEESRKHARLQPIIMTQKQHTRLKREAQERLKSKKESFHSLFFQALAYFIESPEKAPESVRNAIEAVKEQAVDNPRILSTYNRDHGLGYYQLPDGRRSDKMTSEEWTKAAEALLGIGQETDPDFRGAEFFYKGIEAIKGAYLKRTGKPLEITPEQEALLMRALEETLDQFPAASQWWKEAQRLFREYYPNLPHFLDNFFYDLLGEDSTRDIEWHYYEDPPCLTKRDLLEEDENGSKHYSGATAPDTKTKKAQLSEFKADYPELYQALSAQICEAIPSLKGLKPSQLFKGVITWGELATLGFIDYREKIQPSDQEIAQAYMERQDETWGDFTGCVSIAIVQHPLHSQIGKGGDYSAREYGSLEGLDALDEKGKEDVAGTRESLMKPALRWIYAFNVLTSILGNVFDVKELETVQLKTSDLEVQLKAMNNLIYFYYASVFGSAKEKARKRELIKEIFHPVDPQELKPTAEAIEALTTSLMEQGIGTEARKTLNNFEGLISQLMGGRTSI